MADENTATTEPTATEVAQPTSRSSHAVARWRG